MQKSSEELRKCVWKERSKELGRKHARKEARN